MDDVPVPPVSGMGAYEQGPDLHVVLVRARIEACPREDSNLRTRLRRPVLYPLSYEGGHVHRDMEGRGGLEDHTRVAPGGEGGSA
jgi:hypothetical protein